MDLYKTLRGNKISGFNRPSALTGAARLIDPYERLNKRLSERELRKIQTQGLREIWGAVGDYLHFGVNEVGKEIGGKTNGRKSTGRK